MGEGYGYNGVKRIEDGGIIIGVLKRKVGRWWGI